MSGVHKVATYSLKPSLGALLFGVVLVSALLLNVPNTILLLLCVLLYFQFKTKVAAPSSELPVLLLLGMAAWLTIAQFWSDIGSVGWFTTWIWMSIPLSFLAWHHYSKHASQAWFSMQIILAILACTVAIWGIVQFLLLGYVSARGPLADRNVYGCFLNILWFPIFVRFVTTKIYGLALLLYSFTLFVMQLALTMSGSRAAVLIWLLLCATLAIWLWREVDRKKLAIIGLVAVVNYLFFSTFSSHLSLASYLDTVNPASGTPRILMWKSTIHMWLDAPWFGSGLGSWHFVYPLYRYSDEIVTAGFYAHNDYLQFLQEGGGVTWSICFGVLGLLFVYGLYKTKNIQPGVERNENIGILLGICAAILHANVNFTFYLIYINILLGLYMSKLCLSGNRFCLKLSGERQIWHEKLTKSIIVLLVVINAFNALLSSAGLQYLQGDSFVNRISHVISPKFSQYSVAALLVAVRPSDTLAQKYLNASLENVILNRSSLSEQQVKGLMNSVENGYEVLKAENRLDATIYADEANFLLAFDKRYGDDAMRLERARALLEESLSKNPSMVDSAISLADSYFERGDTQVAFEILSKMKLKAWRKRDLFLIDAEILKHQLPEYRSQLNELQSELRGMDLQCAIEKCAEKYLEMERRAEKQLFELYELVYLKYPRGEYMPQPLGDGQ